MSVAETIEAWPATRLTDLAIEWLRERFPGALIVPEFVCGSLSSARVDVAAITSTGIHAIEVKGDGDTHARLATQGPLFAAVCSTVRLLHTPNQPRIADHCPLGWGRFDITDGKLDDGGYPAPDWLLSPRQLLALMWRDELVALHIQQFGGKVRDRKGRSVMALAPELAEVMPLKDIRNGVCRTLRARDWSKPTMVNGSPRRIIQAASDEADISRAQSPEEST